MQEFTEEHEASLLNKEWLVKVDNERSRPCLFKFYSSTVDLSCCLMVTDTKLVWAEVLSSKEFARRWRTCNPKSDSEFTNPEDEDSWRMTNLELLSKAHTLGAVVDMSFKVVDSNYSEFAFQLEYDTFQWRWETNYLGHRRSSEIISKHLIFPLITLGHMALSSSEGVNEMSDLDVEKAVDRVGRTARRTVDTHIKNALAKPRMATTIRRISAMFNFASDLPAIITTAEKPGPEPEAWTKLSRSQTQNTHPLVTPAPELSPSRPSPSIEQAGSHDKRTESATESESDTSPQKGKSPAAGEGRHSPPLQPPNFRERSTAPLSPVASQAAPPLAAPSSESEVSPVRPVKKHKGRVSTDDDEDSEEERRKQLQQLKSGNGASGAKRSVRQPIKRGGKRF